MTIRRLATAAATLALVSGLAACGNKEKVTHVGETEGVYVDVGPMKYQVQISRQLNPSVPEDRTFLSGVSPADTKLGAGETWFAVFVRIENDSKAAQKAATSFEITDTQGDVYRPVTIGSDNPFHYILGDVPAKSNVPDMDSVAGQTSVGGLELLFKVQQSSLQENRPLIFKIHSPQDFSEVSEVDLDI
jgi:hypothetical protein